MASFTVRVELHLANRCDYERLNRMMLAAGYRCEIEDADGNVFCLPEGEFIVDNDHCSAEQIKDGVKLVLDELQKKAFIFVTKSTERSWELILL